MSNDFDEFMGEAGMAPETPPHKGEFGFELKKVKAGARTPLIWQIYSLTPAPPHEKGSCIVQGTLTVLKMVEIHEKMLRLLDQERRELQEGLERYREYVEKDPHAAVRVCWRV